MRPSLKIRPPPLCAIVCFELLLAAGCASVQPGTGPPKSPSSALEPSAENALGKAFVPLAKSHGGDSGFRMLSAGIDGLTARIEMIDTAQRSLDLQSYIFRSDRSGNLVAQALLRAADRGVRVRVLTDDGESVPGDERILSLAAKSGIEIRLFNPLRYRGRLKLVRGAEWLFDEGRLDYRMHNKLMVADNAVAIIGGRNIGDQYFQIDPETQFGDDDLVVAGPIVPRLSAVFDQFWNSEFAIPAPAVDKRHTSDKALSTFLAVLAKGDEPAGVKHAATTSGGAITPVAAVTPGAESTPGADRQPFLDIVSGRSPLICRR